MCLHSLTYNGCHVLFHPASSTHLSSLCESLGYPIDHRKSATTRSAGEPITYLATSTQILCSGISCFCILLSPKEKKNSVKYPNCLDSSYQGACDCWIISIIIIDIASLIFRNRPLYSHYLLWLTRGVQYGWPNTRVLMYECTYSLVDGLCLALALVVSIFRIFSSRHFRHIQKLLCCRFFLFFFFLLSHWRDSRVVASASSLMWYLVCQFL